MPNNDYADRFEGATFADGSQPRHAPRHAAGQIELPPDPPRCHWNALSLALLVSAAVGLGVLSVLVIGGGLGPLALDSAVLNTVVGLRSAKLTEVMQQISALVMPPTLLAVLVVLITFAGGPRPAVATALCSGLAWGCNVVVKHFIARPRPPEELRLAVETSNSFPSSHAAMVMAFFGFLMWLAWHYQRSELWARLQVAALILAVLLVGISRIYLAVHYTSDVLAGYCLAIIWLVPFTRLVGLRLVGIPPVR